jgi:P27 family predicted phage terminase small subunit
MPGRKPVPTALKILRGNPGKRSLPKSEPKPTGIPDCPRHLNKEARTEWDRISKELLVLGLLSEIDRAALAAYCGAWARWVDAEKKVKSQGAVITTTNGNMIQNPYVGIANRAMELMCKFLVEFGMTPSSRSRLQITVEPPKGDDVWSLLLNDKGSSIPLPVQPEGNA